MSTTSSPTIEIDDRRGTITAPAIIVRADGADLNPPQPTRSALNESTPAWDGVPITARHPSRNGEHVSVTDAPNPEIVGVLRSPEWVAAVDGIRGQMHLDADALADAGELGEHAWRRCSTRHRRPGARARARAGAGERRLPFRRCARSPARRGRGRPAPGPPRHSFTSGLLAHRRRLRGAARAIGSLDRGARARARTAVSAP